MRVATTRNAGLIVCGVGIAQSQSAHQGAWWVGGVFGGAGQRGIAGGGPVVDVGHRGGQRDDVTGIAVACSAPRVGAGHVGRVAAYHGPAAVVDQACVQTARRAMEVIGRVETQLGIGRQQEGARFGNCGQTRPVGAAIGRVLPNALCSNGAVGGNGNAGKGVGDGTVAANLVPGVGEGSAKQVGHGVARAPIGVFGARGQCDRGRSACGRIVHAGDGDGDDAGGDQVVAGAVGIHEVAVAGASVRFVQRRVVGPVQVTRPRAGVALVVVGDGDVKAAVPVGCGSCASAVHVGESYGDGFEAVVDLRLGGAGDGDGAGAQVLHKATGSAHRGDGARAHGDRHHHGGGAVVVGVSQGDVGVGRVQNQRCRALAHGHVAGRDLARVVDGRDEQVAGATGDVVDAVSRYRRAVGVERVGSWHSRQPGLLVVRSAVGPCGECTGGNIPQPVVGHHFHLIDSVQVGSAKVGKSDLQARQVRVDIGACAAQFQGLGCTVKRGVHSGCARRRAAQGNAQGGVAGLRQRGAGSIQHPHRHLNDAIRFACDIAISGVDVVDNESGDAGGHAARDSNDARAHRHHRRIIDRGNGDRSGDVSHRVGHAARPYIAADGGRTFAELQRECDVACCGAVLVVVGVACAGVVQTRVAVVGAVSGIAPIEYRLNIGCAACQGQGAGVLATDGDGLAARRGSASRRADVVYVQPTLRHAHGDSDRRIESGRFGVDNHELVGPAVAHTAAHIFIDGKAARAGESGHLVDAGSTQIDRFGGDVAGERRNRRRGFPVVGGAIHGGRAAARGDRLVQLAAVGIIARGKQHAAAVAQAVVYDDFELVERVGVVGKRHRQPR